MQDLRIQRETACPSLLEEFTACRYTHGQIAVVNARIPKQWREVLGLGLSSSVYLTPSSALPEILLVDAILTTIVQMRKLRPRKMNPFPEYP